MDREAWRAAIHGVAESWTRQSDSTELISLLDALDISCCQDNVLCAAHLYPTLRNPADHLLCPWDFPGKNTRVGFHILLQGISPSQPASQPVCPVNNQLSSVQSHNRVQLFATPWTAACQASLSITNSRSLPKLMSSEPVMPSNHLILCCPLLLLSSIFPSIRVFSNESALRIRWPKYWSFSFNISPSSEHPGLITFRMDLLDLLAVQGTLKSPLQHHSSKASILQHSAFFIVQLSHPYMTTGKTMALIR